MIEIRDPDLRERLAALDRLRAGDADRGDLRTVAGDLDTLRRILARGLADVPGAGLLPVLAVNVDQDDRPILDVAGIVERTGEAVAFDRRQRHVGRGPLPLAGLAAPKRKALRRYLAFLADVETERQRIDQALEASIEREAQAEAANRAQDREIAAELAAEAPANERAAAVQRAALAS